jgi:hypothetical protein
MAARNPLGAAAAAGLLLLWLAITPAAAEIDCYGAAVSSQLLRPAPITRTPYMAGAGNNGEDGSEGAQVYNTFGCYLHGSLLPKNPHFADYLITKALERRYGTVSLPPLEDTIERHAHDVMITRTVAQK